MSFLLFVYSDGNGKERDGRGIGLQHFNTIQHQSGGKRGINQHRPKKTKEFS